MTCLYIQGKSTHVDLCRVHAGASTSDLRRNIDRSANTSRHVTGVHVRNPLVRFRLPTSCKSKIADLHVINALGVDGNENVFGLEVSMDDMVTVDMREAL
jgi:hypothetical protein